jgi:MFS family permease
VGVVIAANATSLLGNVMASLAIPWFVLEETGSPLQTGVAAVAASAPLAIGAFFGGTITDRIGPKRASVAGDLLSAISVAGIPLLHVLGALEFWHLLAFAFAGALFDAPAASAREAMLPELTRRAGLRTEQVTSALSATEHAGYVAGAPVAGVLLALSGAPALLWVDAATFVVSAVLVGLLRGPTPALPLPTTGRSRYLRDLRDGLGWILRDRAVLVVTAAATCGAFFIDALSPVILPVYVHQLIGNPAALGLTLGAYGVGGLLGIGLFFALARRVERAPLYRGLWIAYAVASAALILIPPLAGLVVALIAIGITTGAIDPLERAVRQDRVPSRLRGRVFAAMYAVPKVVAPLGILTTGLAIEHLGLQGALLAFAVGNAAIAAVLALARSTASLGHSPITD